MTGYPDVDERHNGAMSVREVQTLHLMALAVELDVLGHSTQLHLIRRDDPALLIPTHTLDKLKVTATVQHGRWVYQCGRQRWLNVGEGAAQRIAEMVTA